MPVIRGHAAWTGPSVTLMQEPVKASVGEASLGPLPDFSEHILSHLESQRGPSRHGRPRLWKHSPPGRHMPPLIGSGLLPPEKSFLLFFLWSSGPIILRVRGGSVRPAGCATHAILRGPRGGLWARRCWAITLPSRNSHPSHPVSVTCPEQGAVESGGFRPAPARRPQGSTLRRCLPPEQGCWGLGGDFPGLRPSLSQM